MSDELPVTIKVESDQYGQIIAGVTFMGFYFILANNGEIKRTDVDRIIKEDILEDLSKRMELSPGQMEVHLSDDDILFLYACFDVMNTLLVSSIGELIIHIFIEKTLGKEYTKEANKLRDSMIKSNNAYLNATKRVLISHPDFKLLNDLLVTLKI
ncbi:MAG: hypothetical protein ABI855_13930 [Bacteroidota bacterium]